MNFPPGTRPMGEDERQDMLETLNDKKLEITNMLERMPISMKTRAAENRKKEMEDKLVEVDKAIQTFSKKIVYVAL
jgi:hypothetical protein